MNLVILHEVMSCADNVMDKVFDYLKELNKGLTQLVSLEKTLPVHYLILTTMSY